MASLHDILTTAGVQDTFVDKLIEDGWSIELFAMAAPNLDKLDEELRSMLGDLYEITTAVQRSALRLAWTRCQATQAPAPPSPSPLHAAPPEGTASQSTWSETYPPKLTSEVVSALKQKFKRNYPAEILLPETTPSLRLLSLIHHQKVKGEFKWVPWKYRLSQAKADEITAVKPQRIAKSEGLQLHALLVDSPPELHIDNGALGMHALRQTFETFSYAMAMCEIAHLATMKTYYLKFINLMTTRLEAETGLRNPTILEAQSADKTLMTIACELVMEKQWTFDDAIHEVTCIRLKSILYFKPVPVFLARPINDWNQDPPKAVGRTIDPLRMAREKQENRLANPPARREAKSLGSQKHRWAAPRNNFACDFRVGNVIWVLPAVFITDVLSHCHRVKLAIKIMVH